MKKFNKVIKVEVNIDSIAEKLLATFSPDFAHKELLTEAIIGSAYEKNGLGYVYNALNGFTNDIDFKVGQVVVCTDTYYGYKLADDGVSFTQGYISLTDIPFEHCIIEEINVYSDKKIKLFWQGMDSKGKDKLYDKWVSHLDCSGISEPVVLDYPQH